MKLKVKENERFVRDSANFAILNTDRGALKQHEQKMENIRKTKERDDEINMLKQDISEIKDMLRQLIKSN
jgi:hypothetical protein